MGGTVIKYGIEALRSARVTARSTPPGGSQDCEQSWEWEESPAAETADSPATRTPPGPHATASAVAEKAVALAGREARICALASRSARAAYQWLVMIAEFDERGGWAGVGIKSCAHWLAWTCSLAPGTAREHVRVARALTELPLVSAEMAAGRLSYAKVREITRIADRVDETYLVTLARTATASQLTRAVRGYRRAAGDRVAQQQTRTATWFTDDDGSVVLSARLPAEEGAALIARPDAAPPPA
jgi:hypothetical protein